MIALDASVIIAHLTPRDAQHAAAMRDDLQATGIDVAPFDAGQPLRLAELRASSGLELPDCCVLDVALRDHACLATFDDGLAAGERLRDVVVLP